MLQKQEGVSTPCSMPNKGKNGGVTKFIWIQICCLSWEFRYLQVKQSDLEIPGEAGKWEVRKFFFRLRKDRLMWNPTRSWGSYALHVLGPHTAAGQRGHLLRLPWHPVAVPAGLQQTGTPTEWQSQGANRVFRNWNGRLAKYMPLQVNPDLTKLKWEMKHDRTCTQFVKRKRHIPQLCWKVLHGITTTACLFSMAVC